MKQLFFSFLFTLLFTSVFSQSNFSSLTFGVGGGPNYTFSDVKKGSMAYSAAVYFDYNITPFISVGLEGQTGTLKGGSRITDPHGREFTNGYSAFILNTKVRAGQFTDYYYNNFLNYTKGAYIGTGIGYVSNSMTDIARTKLQLDGSTYVFPGEDKGTSINVPINIGIDFYFPDKWGDYRYTLNVNYQTNYVLADNMDGYNDPKAMFKNTAADIYNFLSIGIKYNFGPKGLSAKNLF